MSDQLVRVVEVIGDGDGIQTHRILDRAVCERDLEQSDGTIIWDGRVVANAGRPSSHRKVQK